MQRSSQTLVLRPSLQRVDEVLRPTRAEVDLEAIARNLLVVRAGLGQGSGVLAVVKADAYGHGMVLVARRLEREGIEGFGVALAEEGLELRRQGIESEILVLNGVYGSAHAEVLRARLTPVIYDRAQLEAFARVSLGQPFGVHLKVDTGMSRLGVPLSELEPFLQGLADFPAVRIEGLMTHLSSADQDAEATAEQLAALAGARAVLRRHGHDPARVHAGNSAALVRHPEAHLDLVRVGLALYGGVPAPGATASLQPALRLMSQVVAVRELPAGCSVGYNRTFTLQRPSRVATVAIGYGDGLMRSASNRGQMLVRGKRCPIIGRISMDLTTLDVTDLERCAVGDEVVALGAQGEERITPEEAASWADTISYEVLTSISWRVPRVFL